MSDYPIIAIPFDNGFVKTFNLNNFDTDELINFYNKYGFVIFDNILSDNEVNLTISDLWKDMNEYLKKFDDNIHVTEDDCEYLSLPSSSNAYGFVNTGPINQLQCWKNRQNEKIYNAFKILYKLTSKNVNLNMNKDPLVACLDRGSILRPTDKNKDWETKDIYHFDIDPWEFTGTTKVNDSVNSSMYDPTNLTNLTYMLSEGNFGKYNGYPKLSGVLTLSDTNENSGGFECFVGFHNYIHDWCQKHEYNFNIRNDAGLTQNMQKIFMKKGSLMVFTRELPHNIYSNKSDKFRYAQYVRIVPQSELNLPPYLLEKRKKLMKNFLPKSLDVTSDISKELFML
jgi:hypothetical protein